MKELDLEDIIKAADFIIEPPKCQHPAKRPCYHCGERFCPNDGCDPNHIEMCIEANRP